MHASKRSRGIPAWSTRSCSPTIQRRSRRRRTLPQVRKTERGDELSRIVVARTFGGGVGRSIGKTIRSISTTVADATARTLSRPWCRREGCSRGAYGMGPVPAGALPMRRESAIVTQQICHQRESLGVGFIQVERSSQYDVQRLTRGRHWPCSCSIHAGHQSAPRDACRGTPFHHASKRDIGRAVSDASNNHIGDVAVRRTNADGVAASGSVFFLCTIGNRKSAMIEWKQEVVLQR
jgi:hypothetical protein